MNVRANMGAKKKRLTQFMLKHVLCGSRDRNPKVAVTSGILFLTIVISFFSTLCPHTVEAFGLPDIVDDPLLSKPPVLQAGPLLPDGAVIACPSTVDFTQPIGLSEAIDLALCNNPQIKQAWASIKIQAGVLGESRSAYLPTSSATFSPEQTQVKYPDFSDQNTTTRGHTAYVNLNWRLFDFGGRSANNTSAKLLLDAALATHNASIQKAMASVIQSYFDALTAEATMKAKEQAVLLAKSSWETTLRRENRGAVDKSDTLQAEAALAKAQLASSRAGGEYRKAQATLIFTMGLPSKAKLILQEPQGYSQATDWKDLDSWLTQAEQEHPAIMAARVQWESSNEKIIVARSAGLPTVDFVGSFNQNGYPNQGLQATNSNTMTVGLVLTVPIFEGFGTTYKIRGAQAQAEQAKAQMEDVQRQILTEIVKSHADAVSSLANLESSEKLLNAAQNAVNSSMKRYDKGAGDILELLNAQTAMVEAQQERIRCIGEWRSARLRLLANAGSLGRNFVQESR